MKHLLGAVARCHIIVLCHLLAAGPGAVGAPMDNISGGLTGDLKKVPKKEQKDASATAAERIKPIPGEELTPDRQRQLGALLNDAHRAMDCRRFAEAAARLEQAEKLAPGHPDIINSRAALFTEVGQFGEARKLFVALVKVHPEEFVPRFNLAEIDLMEKKYATAREGFLGLLKDFPASDLTHFKVFLTYLLERNGPEAVRWLEKIEYLPRSAVLYYARAAASFAQADLAGGKTWMRAALAEYPSGPHAYMAKVMAEQGWVYLGNPALDAAAPAATPTPQPGPVPSTDLGPAGLKLDPGPAPAPALAPAP